MLRAWLPMPAIVVTVLLLEIDGADRVIFGVGDVQRLAVQAHPLGTIERRPVEAAVVKPFVAAADRDRLGPVEVGLDDPVMAGIGDEQALAGRVGEHLARDRAAGRSRVAPSRA